ncbi:MAG: hypothetical protein HDT19_03760 [Oscillibacter sp.]|nr:hypothetical protein [Oscillibacter sp.]
MKIESSTVSMASTRSYEAETRETQTSITRGYNGDKLVTTRAHSVGVKTKQYTVEAGASVFQQSAGGSGAVLEKETQNASTTGSSETSKPVQQDSTQALVIPDSNWVNKFDCKAEDDPKVQMLRRMLDLLDRISGRKSGRGFLDLPEKLDKAANSAYRMNASAVSARYQQTVSMFAGLDAGQGTGIQLTPSESAVNGHWTRQVVRSGFAAGEEHTAFTSSGSVVTSDGRSIGFNISLEMSRSFETAYSITGQEEVFTDPLVINLDTQAAALSDVTFFFDLNCDGEAEEISGLDSASGFLALDKNGDGKINDGSELFGAKTGDGFSELAQYDEDGNGWIDENDSIFSKLSVWVQCGDGEGKLLSLSEADVGAIFLGKQNSQFTLANSYGDENAVVRSTGVYLKESTGLAGTVQHVDFKA